MFSDEQIVALQKLADQLIAEASEIKARNKSVDEHTAKLNVAQEQIEQLAISKGLEPTQFQLAPDIIEMTSDQKNISDFKDEAAAIAKEHGLDDFAIRKVENA